MEQTRQLFVRGLEYSFSIGFNDSYDKFSVSDLFTAFNSSCENWESAFIADDDHMYCASRLISAINYCSDNFANYSHETHFILFMFKEYKDVQWTERELYRLFATGARPHVPISQEQQNVRDELKKTRRRLMTVVAKRTREGVRGELQSATESAAKLLRSAKSHIIVIPITKAEEEEPNDSDAS